MPWADTTQALPILFDDAREIASIDGTEVTYEFLRTLLHEADGKVFRVVRRRDGVKTVVHLEGFKNAPAKP